MTRFNFVCRNQNKHVSIQNIPWFTTYKKDIHSYVHYIKKILKILNHGKANVSV